MSPCQRNSNPERLFLASRLLFLSTVSMVHAGTYIRTMVESKSLGVIDVIGSKLDLLSRAILAGTKLAREAMTDLLKFTFNLLLHYPKESLAYSALASDRFNVHAACRRF